MATFAAKMTNHRREFASVQKMIDHPASAIYAQFDAGRRDPSRILLLQLPSAGGQALSVKK